MEDCKEGELGSKEKEIDELMHEDADNKTQPDTKQSKITRCLSLSIFTCILGMFQFGCNLGVINAPQHIIEDFYNATYMDRYNRPLPGPLLWSFTVAIFAVGGMLGGLLGASWSQRFGRRKGMLYCGVFGIIAGICMGTSQVAGSFELLIIGRFIIGFNCGLYTSICPLYSSEISPMSIRGGAGTLNQVGLTSGILFSQILGISQLLGTPKLWPLLMAIMTMPAILQMVLLFFTPESPRYLLLSANKEAEAKKSLQRLRGDEDISWEMADMKREKEEGPEKMMSVIELILTPSLRRPLLVGIVVHISQILCGINCIFFYSTELFQTLGLSATTAQYATTATGVVLLAMTGVSIPLMDRLGRRKLQLAGLIGMCALSAVFTLVFVISKREPSAWWLQYAAVVSALMFVGFFSIGPGPMPWIITSELFAQAPRAAAVSIATVVNWGCNFLVGLMFPLLLEWMGDFAFLPFTIILILVICFLWFFLPETKNRSFDDIAKSMHGHTSQPVETQALQIA